jgi:hypothetical protein
MMPATKTDGRWLAAAVLLVYGLLFGLAVHTWGIEPALRTAGVPSVGAPFSDLYVFPAAATEFAHGGNPYLRNPSDPWGRIYNYPRAWLLFMRYPFGAIPELGFALAAAWLLVLGWWWGRLTPRQGLLAGLAACSPPVMLALERGNSDLIIFILVAAALGALARGWRGASWAGLVLSAVLKLFPVVAFVAFLQLGWGRARWWLLAGAVALGGWTLGQLEEIRSIAHNTPTGGPAISYGSAVIFTIADLLHQEHTGQWAGYSAQAWLGGILAVVLAGGFAWWGLTRRSSAPATFDRALAGFQAGACIYLATFIIGSNFAYRQLFLLLCLPWLFRPDGAFPFPRLRTAAAVVLFLLLWSNPQWWLPLIALREAASWSLVGLLAVLVGATLRRPCPKENPA